MQQGRRGLILHKNHVMPIMDYTMGRGHKDKKIIKRRRYTLTDYL
jgi:hypothetical protein